MDVHYISSYPGYCSAGNIDMLSTEGFYFQKKKGLLQHAVDNEVPASARLAFYESLLIELGKKQVSVFLITACSYQAG